MPSIHVNNKRLFYILAFLTVILVLVYLLHGFSAYPNVEKERPDSSPPIILVWTKVFQKAPTFDAWCPMKEEACIYTTNRSRLDTASAVVFHAHDINEAGRLPRPSNPTQKFVFFSQESADSIDKESKRTWWKNAIKFHWVLGYMTKAHIRQPYGGFFVDPVTSIGTNFTVVASFKKEEVLSPKSIQGAVWFVSNCQNQERMEVAKALKKHFRVDIGGKCSPDNADLCPRDRDCRSLISRYYFQLAFENVNCVDYVTEKMTDTLSLPVIPVVMKRGVYQNILPSDAFISVDDFSSASKMAKHLRHLIDNPDEYFKLFKWRNEWTRANWNTERYRIGLCALCEKLWKERDIVVEPIDNLKEWYEENSKCEKAVGQDWFD